MNPIETHPYAEMLPPMTGEEYAALVASIRDIGQTEAIVLLEGQILDGRHRHRACIEVGIEPKTVEYDVRWGDPLAYVYAKSLHRHLTKSQKATVAAKLYAEKKGPVGRPCKGEERGNVAEQVGQFYRVSARYVGMAAALLADAPDLFDQVFLGKANLGPASAQARRRAKAVAAIGRAATRPPEAAADLPPCDLTTGDAVERLAALEPGSVDLILTDPPYNFGFSYDGDPTGDALDLPLYYELLWDLLDGAARVLVPGGAIVMVLPEAHVGEVLAFARASEAGGIMPRLELDHALAFARASEAPGTLALRRLLVWREGFGQHATGNFTGDCRFLPYLVRAGATPYFDADAIRVPSARQALGDSRANPAGRVPGCVLDVPRVAGTFTERVPDEGVPTQLPLALVRPLVRALCPPGGTVCDPFAGTGTVAVAAAAEGRAFVGGDRSARYVEIARRRVADEAPRLAAERLATADTADTAAAPTEEAA